MSNRKGTGLLMVWCEVPDDVEDEFNRWYNEEHIEERLSIPGILSAARYEAVVSRPQASGGVRAAELGGYGVRRLPENPREAV